MLIMINIKLKADMRRGFFMDHLGYICVVVSPQPNPRPIPAPILTPQEVEFQTPLMLKKITSSVT